MSGGERCFGPKRPCRPALPAAPGSSRSAAWGLHNRPSAGSSLRRATYKQSRFGHKSTTGMLTPGYVVKRGKLVQGSTDPRLVQ